MMKPIFMSILFLMLLRQIQCNVTISKKLEQNNEPSSPKIFPTSLKEVCEHANITMENCSCKHTPILCFFNQYIDENGFIGVKLRSSVTYNYAVGTISTVVMLIGLLGNGAVLIVSFEERSNLPKNKELIAQLALVDLVSGIANFMSSVHLFWTHNWIYGAFMCKLSSAFILFTSLLSIGYILIIAVERYVAIICPMRIALYDTKIVRSSIVINFTTALLAVVPTFIWYDLDTDAVCDMKIPFPKVLVVGYFAILLLFFMLVPALIVTAFYVRVIHFLHRTVRTSVVINRDDIRKQRRKSNIRTMKVLIFIMAAFTICVLPTRVIFLHRAIEDWSVDHDLFIAWTFIYNMTYPLHSCINPFVYTAIDSKWRAKFFGLLFSERRESTLSNTKTLLTHNDCKENSLNCEMNDKA